MSPFPLVPRGPLGPLIFPLSGNGDREAIVVRADLCDGEGERAYIAYAPHYIFAFRTHIRS